MRFFGSGEATLLRLGELLSCARRLAVLALCLWATHARGDPPKQVTAFGLTLGQTPESVRSVLSQRYPNCAILPSIYHESAGYPPAVTALFEIARGTLDVCQGGPEGKDVNDELSVNFAHPSIADSQPAYQIDVERAFPDAALVRRGRIVHPFDKIRAELFRTYGRPIEERREKTTSSAADLEKSLSLDIGVAREDYKVRYLWARHGHVDEDLEHPMCDCGPSYVQAVLEISRSPSTIPRNQFFVLSLRILIRDAELGARQDRWNAQWQR